MHLGENRKPLRVSEPVGIQRSSYFISLPWRYGIPLYGSSAVMHWLVSQSLFLARITALNPDGTLDNVNSFSTTGNSPIAVIISEYFPSPRSLYIIFFFNIRWLPSYDSGLYSCRGDRPDRI
jgi:hypothetical protein